MRSGNSDSAPDGAGPAEAGLYDRSTAGASLRINSPQAFVAEVGAGNGIRTRDFDLGKVALYH